MSTKGEPSSQSPLSSKTKQMVSKQCNDPLPKTNPCGRISLKTKHILRAAEFLRDVVLKLSVDIKHLPGTDMLADLLTKSLPRPRPRFLEMIKLLDTLHTIDFVATLK